MHYRWDSRVGAISSYTWYHQIKQFGVLVKMFRFVVIDTEPPVLKQIIFNIAAICPRQKRLFESIQNLRKTCQQNCFTDFEKAKNWSKVSVSGVFGLSQGTIK